VVPARQYGRKVSPESSTVVVTGAGAGVGRATARAFGAAGARVGLLARGNDGLEGARRDVAAAGGNALAVSTDVSDAEAVEAAAATIEEQLGPIDVWVNCAMASIFAFTWDIEPEEFRRATEVVYLGFVWGTQAALRRMRPRNHGTIVQVGSALAYRGIPLQAAYCGGKHAIQGFTESVRAELVHDGSAVHVTSVHLPGLNTPQFDWVRSRLPRHPQPVPPIYQPEVAARAILWAAGQRRREVWVGGSTVATIVGNALVPSLLDRYLGKTNVKAQQTGEPVPPNRADYLFSPLPGDRGAHGSFDSRAHARSVQLWATTHRRGLLAGAGVAAAAAGALWRRP
jgi:NAD(P)-dependent dehydrogenase (short-subunit alcohol dehydrogenase family)